jgi:hypothetical protein
MKEESLPPEFSTKPAEDFVRKDPKVPHNIMVRIHQSDWELMRVMLRRDGLSFQKFATLCSKAYLEGDPNIVKSIRTYREYALVPKDQQEKGVFSNRERAEIYNTLEKEDK